MKRKLAWITAAFLILLSAVTARSVYRSRKAAANRVVIEGALRRFSQEVPLGTARREIKNLLRAQGVPFKESCCSGRNGPFSILVQVGQQDPPWYCSEWRDYVAFEFSTTTVNRPPTEILESDTLRLVQLTSYGEGCL